MSEFPPGSAYIDGKYVPMSEAKISILDWGLLRSDATYDVVHVWKDRFFRLDRHVDRFLASIDKLRMTLPFGRARLEEILNECVVRSGLEDAYVEMILTRGRSPNFSRDPRDAQNNFIAFAIPFGWIATEEQRKAGMRLWISEVPRIPSASVDPTVKNYHWLDLVAGMFDAYDNGFETVVLSDGSGNVTEGPGFNLFSITDGKALTPSTGVLEGITRRTAMELLEELSVPVEMGLLSEEALLASDEVFVTSTAGGIVPVGEISGQRFGAAIPGPVTRELTALYWNKHIDPAWTTPVVRALAAE